MLGNKREHRSKMAAPPNEAKAPPRTTEREPRRRSEGPAQPEKHTQGPEEGWLPEKLLSAEGRSFTAFLPRSLSQTQDIYLQAF